MENTKIFSLAIIVALLSGCQQSPQPLSLQQQEAQSQQLASVIAATRYLKSHCQMNQLPEQSQIIQAAAEAGRKRGWQPPPDMAARGEQLYQRLLSDQTPVATQCAAFRPLLQPFIGELNG